MGTSTDAQLCFGVALPEDTDIPWRCDKFGFDFEDWWRVTTGYHPPFELFDSRGAWLDGSAPPVDVVSAYYAAQKAWDAAHPAPVLEVWHCSDRYKMFIVAVPGTLIEARRGYPQPIAALPEVDPAQVRAFTEFCQRYFPEVQAEPGWLLSSWWG